MVSLRMRFLGGLIGVVLLFWVSGLIRIMTPYYSNLSGRIAINVKLGGSSSLINKRTMLLMSDSRPLEAYDHHLLAYTINSHYAKRHGYRIRFFPTPCLDNSPQALKRTDAKKCVGCVHPKWGERSSSWCKLLAVNDTMYRYASEVDRIVYIDSEAFVNRLNSPLKEEYFNWTLNMFWNAPFLKESPVNSGIQFWQNTEAGREFLAAWWNSNTDRNTAPNYEQSVFYNKTTSIHWRLDEINEIRETVFEWREEIGEDVNPQPFFRHITAKRPKGACLERMEAFIKKHSITAYQSTAEEFAPGESQKPPPPERTMLLMSDSRPLSFFDYHQLAYRINSYYAKRHGYLIRYVPTPCLNTSETDKIKIRGGEPETKRCIGCVHPKWGARAPPWCKLLAINDTMYRYASEVDRIVYIDSDAFVNKLDSVLEERYFRRTLNMFWNAPFLKDSPVCSGIQFWKNTELGRQTLAAWWDSNTSYNTVHSYEQSVFNENTTMFRRLNEFNVIKENVFEWREELGEDGSPQPFFRHISVKRPEGARRKRMEAFIQRHNITSD